ncbi:MAG: hypothetical protein MUF31_14705 [Akkermansiaceae bacterium]|jgi:ADP-heptose:LPS heptosyltransferase|nr:hypothetical protein [Akkermansiaceae bacterium]
MDAAVGEPLWIAAPLCLREACFSLPAVRAIAALRPVRMLVPADQQAWWKISGAGEVVSMAEKVREIAAQLADCREILLWEAGSAADAAVKTKVRRRTGLPAPGLAKRLTHPLERIVHPGPPEHRVKRYLDTAALLGASPAEAKFFEALPAPMPRRERTLLLDPGSDFGRHFEWPLERWSALLDLLRPDPQRTAVVASSPAIREWAGALGLATVETAEIGPFSAAGLLVSAENRRLHLAAAFGTRCVVLYGPGDPALHRPLGRQHVAIRRKAECSPCFAERCPLDLRCQNELEVPQVAAALGPLIPS